MRAAAVGLILAATVTGCQKPARWDSTNPVHCMTVFGIVSGSAAAQSNQAVVKDLTARQLVIVQANGGLPWIEQIKPESQRLAAEIQQANDEAALSRLLDDCAARHPVGGSQR
jgi:hypothetical protein